MKPLKQFEDYAITTCGNVVYLKKGKIRKQLVNENGYKFVTIRGKNLRVHRLIAEAYIINPENKKCVNHKDGNKLNNLINNLEWCTHSENNLHAYKLGLNYKNKKHTIEDKKKIFELFEKKWRNIDIAEHLGIPLSIVQKYLKNTYKPKYKKSVKERILLKKIILSSNKTNIELSKEIKISSSLIGKIKKNIAWNDV